MKKVLISAGFIILLIGLSVIALLSAPKSFLSQIELSPKSSVEIKTQSNNLMFSFNLTPSDTVKARALSERFGMNNDWQKGVAIGLDTESVQQLNRYLPINVNVSFENDTITFSSKGLITLDSSLTRDQYAFASSSGKINIVRFDDGFEIKVEQPSIVLKEATRSGQITVSPKLSPLFPILEKIDTIEVQGALGKLKGQIQLK